MVIYKDVPVLISIKMKHIRKIGGKLYNSFITEYGDVPVAVYNESTKQFEEVQNNRGNGYAGRNRKMYRTKKNTKVKHKSTNYQY